jgi:beta-lactamase class A
MNAAAVTAATLDIYGTLSGAMGTTRHTRRAALAALAIAASVAVAGEARGGHASDALPGLRSSNPALDRGWARRVAVARRYAATRPGTIAFAVRTPLRIHGDGVDRVFASASVVKAMLLVAYARGARDRRLTASERALLGPMIRRSDDEAANAIFVRVGTAGLQRLARAAGMTRFAPASPIWGNAQITARDQTRFFLRLDRLLPQRHRTYALRLLRTVVPSQRWGIGRLRLRGWRVHFKGGWGSGTGRVDHQVALLTRGERRLAVAVLTAGNGSHAVGMQTLEGVFRRLLRGQE